MKELFEFAFSGINLIPTALLLFVALYWLVVLFGLFDMGHVEMDADHDVHVDAHIHAEADMEADADTDVHHGGEISEGGPGGIMQSLMFFNVGKVPLLILLSFFTVPLWFMVLLVNYYLNVESIATALLLLIPEMIICLFIAKFLTSPIAHLFKRIEETTGQATDFTGKTAFVRFDMEKNKPGYIEIDENGKNIVLHALCEKTSLAKGERVLIIELYTEENYYIVEPF
jgi:hypothetical protein